jgi:hypothetical protein
VYVHEPPLEQFNEPLSTSFTTAKVRSPESSSTSVPVSVKPSASPSPVDSARFATVGASFTGVTVMVTVAVFESEVPSLAT